MDLGIIKELTYNFALLLMLCVIYETRFLVAKRWEKHVPAINGVSIAIIGVAIMSFPLHFVSGMIVDTRTILLSVTAIVFGAVPAIIAGSVLIVYRIILGGSGLWMGLITITSSTAIGLLWRNRLLARPGEKRMQETYLFGLAVHAVMVVSMFALPRDTAIQSFQQIALPVIVLYPFGTVLLSLLLFQQKDRDEACSLILEAEKRYASLFNNNHAAMMLLDPKTGEIVDINPAACSFYGWPAAQMKSMNICDINPLPREEVVRELERAASCAGGPFVFQHCKASGEVVDVEVYRNPIQLDNRTLIHSIIYDISLRVQADAARQQSEKRFRSLVEGAPDAIFIQTEGLFSFVNTAAVRLFGATSAEDLLGRPAIDRFHPDVRQTMLASAKELGDDAAKALPGEVVFLRLDGSEIMVDVTAVPIEYNENSGTVVFARDISARKLLEREKQEMEAQMRQQQKLEAIGTLAGGVAHEINNPLNGIMNYAQLICDEASNQPVSLEYAREIIHETQRISAIVKNLLQFSRQEKESHSLASVYDIVNQTISLVRTIIRKDQIQLEVDLEKNLPPIKCRSQQIQQVLMNLLTNARDALNEKYPGYSEQKIIRLTCRQVERDGRQWVDLAVRDNGNGIPQKVQGRIFEPFFSTKPKDIGTGLGLSISFGIVKDHCGKLRFRTEDGQNTEFTVSLPADA